MLVRSWWQKPGLCCDLRVRLGCRVCPRPCPCSPQEAQGALSLPQTCDAHRAFQQGKAREEPLFLEPHPCTGTALPRREGNVPSVSLPAPSDGRGVLRHRRSQGCLAGQGHLSFCSVSGARLCWTRAPGTATAAPTGLGEGGVQARTRTRCSRSLRGLGAPPAGGRGGGPGRGEPQPRVRGPALRSEPARRPARLPGGRPGAERGRPGGRWRRAGRAGSGWARQSRSRSRSPDAPRPGARAGGAGTERALFPPAAPRAPQVGRRGRAEISRGPDACKCRRPLPTLQSWSLGGVGPSSPAPVGTGRRAPR